MTTTTWRRKDTSVITLYCSPSFGYPYFRLSLYAFRPFICTWYGINTSSLSRAKARFISSTLFRRRLNISKHLRTTPVFTRVSYIHNMYILYGKYYIPYAVQKSIVERMVMIAVVLLYVVLYDVDNNIQTFSVDYSTCWQYITWLLLCK